jgi:hypothetical protein
MPTSAPARARRWRQRIGKTVGPHRRVEPFRRGGRVKIKGEFEEVEMSLLLIVCLALGMPLVGLAVYDIQNRLESWAHDRHAED